MTENSKPRTRHKFYSIIVNIFGIVECFAASHIVFTAIKTMRNYSSTSDTTGVGSLVILMGILMGGGACILLLFAGIGLLKSKRYGRVLNIIIALLLVIGMLQNFYMADWDCDISEIAILTAAAILLTLMYLPSVKRQFKRTDA